MTDQFNVTPLFGIPLYQSTLQTIDQDSIDYIKNTEYKRFRLITVMDPQISFYWTSLN